MGVNLYRRVPPIFDFFCNSGNFLVTGMQRRIRLEMTHPKDRMVVVSQVLSVSVGDIVLNRHQDCQSSSNRKSESETNYQASPDDSSTSGVASANQSLAASPEQMGPSCLQLIIIKQNYVQVCKIRNCVCRN